MVAGKRKEVGIDKDNVLEVVNDRLAVEEVVYDNKEVPGVSYRLSEQDSSPVDGLAPLVTLLASAELGVGTSVCCQHGQ